MKQHLAKLYFILPTVRFIQIIQNIMYYDITEQNKKNIYAMITEAFSFTKEPQ